MAFQPGQSGNPSGRGTEKVWRDALLRAVRRRENLQPDDGKAPQRLELIAEAMVIKAISGDVQAGREIGDRLDGKALQQIQAEIDTGERAVISDQPMSEEEWSKAYGSDSDLVPAAGAAKGAA